MVSPRTPPSRHNVHAIFEKYDRNKAQALDIEDLRKILDDFGFLKGKSRGDSDAMVLAHFTAADHDRDSRLAFDEFSGLYSQLTAPSLRKTLTQQFPALMGQIRTLYDSSTTGTSRPGLSNTAFVKLVRTCPGLSEFHVTDLDLIFAKVKSRGERNVTYDQFIEALQLVGNKHGQPVQEVLQLLANARADFGSSLLSPLPPSSPISADVAPKSPSSPMDRELSTRLHQVFCRFSAFGATRSTTPTCLAPAGTDPKAEMDCTRLVKLCRDARVVGGRLKSSAVELAFAKVKPKVGRRIGYKDFLRALALVAEAKGVSEEEVLKAIAACPEPTLTATTTPEAVKWYDDKRLYTGSHRISLTAVAAP